MGDWIQLTAAGGHRFQAYQARPSDTPRAGLVVCQEIFGVNEHIREVTDGFAKAGYLAVAPALFDRVEREVELTYDEAGIAKGREIKDSLDFDGAMEDVSAAVDFVRRVGKVGVVGYCWGGTLAWLAACRLPVDAAVGYYGGQIHAFREEDPDCPVVLHFGDQDPQIPEDHVAEIQALHPEIQVYIYAAGHGFNCDHRGSFDQDAASIAQERTLACFDEYLE